MISSRNSFRVLSLGLIWQSKEPRKVIFKLSSQEWMEAALENAKEELSGEKSKHGVEKSGWS